MANLLKNYAFILYFFVIENYGFLKLLFAKLALFYISKPGNPENRLGFKADQTIFPQMYYDYVQADLVVCVFLFVNLRLRIIFFIKPIQ
jgi:hypothetical protein